MNTRLFVIILLTIIPSVIYCQEMEQEEKNFHFIDAGIGAGYSRSTHGAVNVALSNGLRKYIANFIDYNLAFGKSEVLFHEFNFKIGPYIQFNRYSYIAVSSGLSFMWNTPMTEYDYDNFYRYYTFKYSEGEHLISIPIQAKINIGVYKGCCFGFKGTYNKMYEKRIEDKGTVLMYLAWGW